MQFIPENFANFHSLPLTIGFRDTNWESRGSECQYRAAEFSGFCPTVNGHWSTGFRRPRILVPTGGRDNLPKSEVTSTFGPESTWLYSPSMSLSVESNLKDRLFRASSSKVTCYLPCLLRCWLANSKTHSHLFGLSLRLSSINSLHASSGWSYKHST